VGYWGVILDFTQEQSSGWKTDLIECEIEYRLIKK